MRRLKILMIILIIAIIIVGIISCINKKQTDTFIESVDAFIMEVEK